MESPFENVNINFFNSNSHLTNTQGKTDDEGNGWGVER